MSGSFTASFSIGDRVLLAVQPPYFKTADPMPMLRPPDFVMMGTEGVITGQRPKGYWVVHFNQGDVLLESQWLEPVAIAPPSPDTPN